MRVQPRASVRPARDGRHPIAAVAPLPLDPALVAELGIVRVAFDAVREDERVNAIKDRAKVESQRAYEAASAASADLARRSAEAYARSAAAFVKPEALPPF